MRLIEKIKKLLRLPHKCSTCRHWEHMYDKFGDCKLLSRQDGQVMEDCEHVCSMYERRYKCAKCIYYSMWDGCCVNPASKYLFQERMLEPACDLFKEYKK